MKGLPLSRLILRSWLNRARGLMVRHPVFLFLIPMAAGLVVWVPALLSRESEGMMTSPGFDGETLAAALLLSIDLSLAAVAVVVALATWMAGHEGSRSLLSLPLSRRRRLLESLFPAAVPGCLPVLLALWPLLAAAWQLLDRNPIALPLLAAGLAMLLASAALVGLIAGDCLFGLLPQFLQSSGLKRIPLPRSLVLLALVGLTAFGLPLLWQRAVPAAVENGWPLMASRTGVSPAARLLAGLLSLVGGEGPGRLLLDYCLLIGVNAVALFLYLRSNPVPYEAEEDRPDRMRSWPAAFSFGRSRALDVALLDLRRVVRDRNTVDYLILSPGLLLTGALLVRLYRPAGATADFYLLFASYGAGYLLVVYGLTAAAWDRGLDWFFKGLPIGIPEYFSGKALLSLALTAGGGLLLTALLQIVLPAGAAWPGSLLPSFYVLLSGLSVFWGILYPGERENSFSALVQALTFTLFSLFIFWAVSVPFALIEYGGAASAPLPVRALLGLLFAAATGWIAPLGFAVLLERKRREQK